MEVTILGTRVRMALHISDLRPRNINYIMTEDEIKREYNRIKDEYGDAAPLWSEFLEARKGQLHELKVKRGDIMIATKKIWHQGGPGIISPGERVRITSCFELDKSYVVTVIGKDRRYYTQIVLWKNPEEWHRNPLKEPRGMA